MQTHFKGTDYELTPEITAHAKKKMGSLRKYLGPARHNAHAYVDLGKETGEHHNQGRIWYTDINLDADGTRFYAKATEESMEQAIDKAVAELASELKTARKRQVTLVRKDGMLFKSLMQGF